MLELINIGSNLFVSKNYPIGYLALQTHHLNVQPYIRKKGDDIGNTHAITADT